MDVAEAAFLETESTLKYQLHLVRRQKNFRSVRPEGFCHYCEEEVQGVKLFCNGKCASSFERKR